MSRKSTLDNDYITGSLSNFSPDPRTLATDPKVLAKYIASDFSSFYWKDVSQED